MTLQTKKIFARELLLLACSFLLAVVVFLIIYPFNWFYHSKAVSLQKDINLKTKMVDSLSFSYLTKQKNQTWYFEENEKNDDMPKFNTSDKLWDLMEELDDSIEYRYEKVWDKRIITFLNKIGFQNAKSFKEFIHTNTITTKDKENRNKATEIETEIGNLNLTKTNYKDKALSFDEQKSAGFSTFVIILIILYPIRLLYLSILWSIKTLKQKNS